MKISIVLFRDGSYGIRKRAWFSPDRYMDLTERWLDESRWNEDIKNRWFHSTMWVSNDIFRVPKIHADLEKVQHCMRLYHKAQLIRAALAKDTELAMEDKGVEI